MRIGFYAPLKAPDHPTPSGDRQMARLLMAALGHAGHAVTLLSRLRSFSATPDAPLPEAEVEIARLAALWHDPAARPELLLTYHPYYKAPDLLGPVLAARFALPYATAEASLSGRRASGPWGARQALVAAAVRQARLNICLTARDRAGLADAAAAGSFVEIPPFIDAGPFAAADRPAAAGPVRLVTVAMMRPGDKLDSYRVLGEALGLLRDLDWRLAVVGDGAARPAVEAALAPLGAERIAWAGACPSEAVPGVLREADLFVWPGLNEAFGLCYLEAQAARLPVVAIDNAGTPSVIRHGETGLLTARDPAAFAAAVRRLIEDAALRRAMGTAAAAFAAGDRGLPTAAARIDAALQTAMRDVAA